MKRIPLPCAVGANKALTAFPVALLAATFGLLQTDTRPGLILKFFVSKLVYSTSDAAALFLLGFAAIALLCRHLKLSERWTALAAMLVWGGMLLGYGANLAATLEYHREHHIPFSAHVYHWSDGINSYTALLHSHLGKSAIAASVGVLSGNSNYDTGNALAGSVPHLQAGLIGTAFLATLAGALLWMPIFHARFGPRPVLTAAYLISAATAVKSMLDGGLLAYSVLPSLLLMASFHLSPDELAWRNFWRRRGWLVGFIVLGSYVYLWLGLTADKNIPLFGPWLFFITVLILLATASWRGMAAWLCRGLLTTYLIVNWTFDYGDNLAPLLRKVGIDHRAASFDASGQCVSQPLAAWYGKPVFLAYRGLGDDPWKPRTTLLWKVPTRGQNAFHASLRLLSWDGNGGDFEPTPELKITRIATADRGWLEIDIAGTSTHELPPIFLYGSGNALSRNNYYVWLYQIDQLLRRSGWRSYILLPHTAGNASARDF